MKTNISQAGLFGFGLRLVVGWTYFSALWRRLVLSDKLNPDLPGYIGEKFNHFLPNALGIKPLIEYLVTHPDILWWNMVIFTIIEGIVGLCIMLGLFTRLMSVGVIFLALGILLGSGWIGTTCLDEWQIGILGMAAGFLLLLSGSGSFSLDQYFLNKSSAISKKSWFVWLASGELPMTWNSMKKTVFIGSMAILGITLFTNQYFHGGLWGTLHNKSVKPHIEISDITYENHTLNFEIFRTEGVDVYGSYLIGIAVTNSFNDAVLSLDNQGLAKFNKENIQNKYVSQVKTGPHSLVIPLGAKANLTLEHPDLRDLDSGTYQLKLIDISGAEWISSFKI